MDRKGGAKEKVEMNQDYTLFEDKRSVLDGSLIINKGSIEGGPRIIYLNYFTDS